MEIFDCCKFVFKLKFALMTQNENKKNFFCKIVKNEKNQMKSTLYIVVKLLKHALECTLYTYIEEEKEERKISQ